VLLWGIMAMAGGRCGALDDSWFYLLLLAYLGSKFVLEVLLDGESMDRHLFYAKNHTDHHSVATS